MTQNYAACTSYQDEGVYSSTFTRDNSGTESRSEPFKTYFVRPGLFRLEWKEPWYQHNEPAFSVLWRDGNNTFSYRQMWDKLEHEKSLSRGVYNTTSPAGGPSHLAPVMLLSDINTFLSIHLKSLAVAGEEEVRGVRCYHLSGRFSWFLGAWEMWVGKDDHLLHKFEYGGKAKNGYLRSEEIHSGTLLNAAIPRETFSFQPPPGLKAVEAPR